MMLRRHCQVSEIFVFPTRAIISDSRGSPQQPRGHTAPEDERLWYFAWRLRRDVKMVQQLDHSVRLYVLFGGVVFASCQLRCMFDGVVYEMDGPSYCQLCTASGTSRVRSPAPDVSRRQSVWIVGCGSHHSLSPRHAVHLSASSKQLRAPHSRGIKTTPTRGAQSVLFIAMSTMSATTGAAAGAAAYPPPLPPGLTYTAALAPSLNLVLIGTVWSAFLVPIAIALFFFSTAATRRQPVFIMNVLSISFGLVEGAINIYNQVRIVYILANRSAVCSSCSRAPVVDAGYPCEASQPERGHGLCVHDDPRAHLCGAGAPLPGRRGVPAAHTVVA